MEVEGEQGVGRRSSSYREGEPGVGRGSTSTRGSLGEVTTITRLGLALPVLPPIQVTPAGPATTSPTCYLTLQSLYRGSFTSECPAHPVSLL